MRKGGGDAIHPAKGGKVGTLKNKNLQPKRAPGKNTITELG